MTITQTLILLASALPLAALGGGLLGYALGCNREAEQNKRLTIESHEAFRRMHADAIADMGRTE